MDGINGLNEYTNEDKQYQNYYTMIEQINSIENPTYETLKTKIKDIFDWSKNKLLGADTDSIVGNGLFNGNGKLNITIPEFNDLQTYYENDIAVVDSDICKYINKGTAVSPNYQWEQIEPGQKILETAIGKTYAVGDIRINGTVLELYTNEGFVAIGRAPNIYYMYKKDNGEMHPTYQIDDNYMGICITFAVSAPEEQSSYQWIYYQQPDLNISSYTYSYNFEVNSNNWVLQSNGFYTNEIEITDNTLASMLANATSLFPMLVYGNDTNNWITEHQNFSKIINVVYKVSNNQNYIVFYSTENINYTLNINLKIFKDEFINDYQTWVNLYSSIYNNINNFNDIVAISGLYNNLINYEKSAYYVTYVSNVIYNDIINNYLIQALYSTYSNYFINCGKYNDNISNITDTINQPVINGITVDNVLGAEVITQDTKDINNNNRKLFKIKINYDTEPGLELHKPSVISIYGVINNTDTLIKTEYSSTNPDMEEFICSLPQFSNIAFDNIKIDFSENETDTYDIASIDFILFKNLSS